MPLLKPPKKAKKRVKRAIASKNISEFHHGKTYAKTLRKFGKARANRQAIAVGLNSAGLSKRKKARKRK